MQLRIISVSKVKQDFILQGEREYAKRLTQWAKLTVSELNVKVAELSEEETKAREGAALISQLKPSDFLIALDERGNQYSSQQFADLLQEKMVGGVGAITFAIGGAFGFDAVVKKRAQLSVSLSRLTFPYQLSRLILIEQIYRAFTLMNGLPYHKK